MPEIVELDKCIYGLPQASNRFREHSDGVLRGIGFVPTISDELYQKIMTAFSEGSGPILQHFHESAKDMKLQGSFSVDTVNGLQQDWDILLQRYPSFATSVPVSMQVTALHKTLPKAIKNELQQRYEKPTNLVVYFSNLRALAMELQQGGKTYWALNPSPTDN
jgi:hypothetical protein